MINGIMASLIFIVSLVINRLQLFNLFIEVAGEKLIIEYKKIGLRYIEINTKEIKQILCKMISSNSYNLQAVKRNGEQINLICNFTEENIHIATYIEQELKVKLNIIDRPINDKIGQL